MGGDGTGNVSTSSDATNKKESQRKKQKRGGSGRTKGGFGRTLKGNNRKAVTPSPKNLGNADNGSSVASFSPLSFSVSSLGAKAKWSRSICNTVKQKLETQNAALIAPKAKMSDTVIDLKSKILKLQREMAEKEANFKSKIGQLQRDMADKDWETKETEAEYILELKRKDNRVKAIDQIHKQEIDKLKCEFRLVSHTLSSTRKVTDEVSFHFRSLFYLHSTCLSCVYCTYMCYRLSLNNRMSLCKPKNMPLHVFVIPSSVLCQRATMLLVSFEQKGK